MIAGNNAITARENNIALVIRLLHKAKVCSRAYLAKQTGLKQATMTYIIDNLLSWKLVEETGTIEGELKRRSIGITLNDKVYRLLGIRLNRDYVSAALFTIKGEIVSQREVTFDRSTKPETVMSYMIKLVRELIETASDEDKILGIGVAIPGPFVPSEGKIKLMSGSPGWENTDIKQILNAEFGIPVFLEHDANCGALVEYWYGEVGDAKDILFLALDTGVGAGILSDGQLFKGSLGTAGEVGHMSIDRNGPKCECGNHGCLEMYCSTKRLIDDYQKAALKPRTLDEILKAVDEGDSEVRKIYAEAASDLGFGLVNLINILSPKLIILSGKLSLGGEYLIEVVSGVLKENLLPALYQNTEIRLGTRFDGETMLYGAGAVVLENILLEPTQCFNPESAGKARS